MITLAIDYGASNVGIALVRNTEAGNEPLFAGTVILDARKLKEKVETRAGIRGLRRTRKTKNRRLRELGESLSDLGIERDKVARIVRFSNRRGYKSLFSDPNETGKVDEAESAYRCTREQFFQQLEQELQEILSDGEAYEKALSACERILNRKGDRYAEIRLIRIDNRGASRCAWAGCNKVTPRRDNATDDAIAQQLVTYFQSAIKTEPDKLEMLNQTVCELDSISKNLRGAIANDDDSSKKILRRRARKSLRNLRAELPSTEPEDVSDDAWKYVEKGILNILQNSGGRNRYCREHSKSYVEKVLEGKPPEFKNTITDSDIISRREQIAFSKLWRYIEARLLPLAPKGIDRIVVERTAFDLLAGKRKKIREASSEGVENIYQYGPMYGFPNEKGMLRKEFGGLCAYCGNPSDTLMDRDHILPRRDFFFDSYLNILPACPSCNAEKSASLPSHVSLRISEDAYSMYKQYLTELASKRPLHFLHTEKKGILNLMRDPTRSWEVEKYLSLIANNFASIVQTQRGPRPFARYLYSKLSTRQKKSPKIVFMSGKHTALYRSVAYPLFSKAQEKRQNDGNGNPVNHALDAILLACKLPDSRPLEARGLNLRTLGTWRRAVMAKVPPAGEDGIPVLPDPKQYVQGFESTDANGYVTVEMCMMNWNQKDSGTHKQDPYGWSEKEQKPTKRVAAKSLFDELRNDKSKKKPDELIKRIYHTALRAAVEKAFGASQDRLAAAEALKKWLRESVRNSLSSSSFSRHPSDMRRKQDLEKFAHEDGGDIPIVIGVKCLDPGVKGKIDAQRLDRRTGKTSHRYMTDPPNRGMIIAYPSTRSGQCDRGKPCTAGIRQNYSLKTEDKTIFKPKSELIERGVVWGNNRGSLKDLETNFSRALEQYLSQCGFHSYCILTAGCVVCYEDGTQRFIRNFDKSKDFKKAIRKNIMGVRRTPFSNRVVPLKVLTEAPAKE
jgi:hypothetical protein